MGGVIVKRILVEAAQSSSQAARLLAARTRGTHDIRLCGYPSLCPHWTGVVFYSTPHFGSPLAKLSSPIDSVTTPSIEVQEMAEGSPKLAALNARFLGLAHVQCLSLLETQLTPLVSRKRIRVDIVPERSAQLGRGAIVRVAQADHMTICKPTSKEDVRYQELVKFLRGIVG
jgi:protein SERAC1